MECAPDPVDEYIENAYPIEVDALRLLGHADAADMLECGLTCVRQRDLEELMEENRRLERRVRELECADLPF